MAICTKNDNPSVSIAVPWPFGCPSGFSVAPAATPPSQQGQTSNPITALQQAPGNAASNIVSGTPGVVLPAIKLLPDSVTNWIGNSANWKHVALIFAGGVLVLVGLIAFVVEPDIKHV